ncbi:MAG: hypothetical protein ACK5P7_01525 [Bdellovibrio sp.]
MSELPFDSLSEYGLQILSPQEQGPRQHLVKSSYLLWHDVWSATLAQLDGTPSLYSDDFSRQDEIVVLTSAEKPIGLVMHRYCNSTCPSVLDDSYFRCWPAQAKQQITHEGPRLVIGSNITLHPDFRKSVLQTLPLKRLLAFASLAHLSRQSGLIDAITGTMRVDKGMHDLFYSAGAVCLEKNILFHNVSVDLVGFFPKTRPLNIPKLEDQLIQQLHENGKRRFQDDGKSANSKKRPHQRAA